VVKKRRISLAVDMGLSEIMADQYGSQFNLIVFDEQDSYLDDQGRKAYMNLLKDLSKQKAVYVVAHDSEFKSQFDEVITIQKREGVSAIC
jgi:DNA repair exonuclease SbcCD ATPase subunit